MNINNHLKNNRKNSVNSLLLLLLSLLLTGPSVTFGDSDLQCREADKSKGEIKIVRDIEEWNSHCIGHRDVQIQLSASQNNQIVLDSIKKIKSSCGSKSVFEGIIEQSTEGFVIEFHLENNGECIRDPFLGQLIARDGRGHCRATFCWIEVKQEIE